MGLPCMECDVSSKRRQGHLGSGLSANSLLPKPICSNSDDIEAPAIVEERFEGAGPRFRYVVSGEDEEAEL
jgi:hypothetical protein